MGVYHNGYKMLGNNIVDPGPLLGKTTKKAIENDQNTNRLVRKGKKFGRK